MKKILWISRHKMTKEQTEDLERILGDTFETHMINKTLNSISQLTEEDLAVDTIAAVLPTHLLADLRQRAGEIPVIQAVSKRAKSGKMTTLSDGSEMDEFIFVHDRWEQIIRLDLELKIL